MNFRYIDLLPSNTLAFTSANAVAEVVTDDGNWLFKNTYGGALVSSNGFDKTSITYLRTDTAGQLNKYIEVTFPKPYTIGKYVLELGRYNVSFTNMASWNIEARVNNQWQVVHSGTNTQTTAIKEYEFTPVLADGIRIVCTGKYGTNSWGFDNFYLYEYEILPYNQSFILNNGFYKKYDPSTLQWVDVTNSTPSKSQFLEQGMVSISPLLDRKEQNLTPSEMILDTTYDNGNKLFKRTINLDDIYDLVGINIEKRNS